MPSAATPAVPALGAVALAAGVLVASGAGSASPSPGTSAPAPAAAPTAAPVRVAPEGASAWSWPLAPDPVVLRGFDDVARYAAGHRGVDLAASPGQAVLAPAAGRVVFAGPVAGRSVVVVEHAGGLRSTVEPVLPLVGVGTAVRAGEVLGAVPGSPAHCVVACLHLGVRRAEAEGGDYVDPLGLLAPAAPPVLLPVGSGA